MARSTKKNNTRSTKRSKTKTDPYQELTDRIVEKIKQGVKPWQPRWKGYGLAKNMATDHIYTGINAFILNLLTPHPIPYYMSYKQAKEQGGQVKKGAKAERVYFYKSYYKDENGSNISQAEGERREQEGGNVERIQFLKFYHVFNIEDIEGVEVDTPEHLLNPNETIEACEAVIKGYQNGPEHVKEDGNRAYYMPSKDLINLPELERFNSSEDYYLTMFHELAHSTGHAKRLNRDGITKPNEFRSQPYAKEELIAELGAAFLAGHAGIGGEDAEDQNASYLGGWLSVLENDTKLIFRAAAEAQRAVDHILDKK